MCDDLVFYLYFSIILLVNSNNKDFVVQPKREPYHVICNDI